MVLKTIMGVQLIEVALTLSFYYVQPCEIIKIFFSIDAFYFSDCLALQGCLWNFIFYCCCRERLWDFLFPTGCAQSADLGKFHVDSFLKSIVWTTKWNVFVKIKLKLKIDLEKHRGGVNRKKFESQNAQITSNYSYFLPSKFAFKQTAEKHLFQCILLCKCLFTVCFVAAEIGTFQIHGRA